MIWLSGDAGASVLLPLWMRRTEPQQYRQQAQEKMNPFDKISLFWAQEFLT